MHAEFSSQLINYAVLTLATVSFSLCKHEAAQNGKGVGRAQQRRMSSPFKVKQYTHLIKGGFPNTCF